MSCGRQVSYGAQFRTRDSNDAWRPFYGTVRSEIGDIMKAEDVCGSVPTMREAISQWDEEGRYEWRIRKRTTEWREETVETI